ncbi:MAG TPA: EamA family transporter [Candidatus Kapabacteria bacterium]|nr:EamA family transporter [Candidatus Kapabacteria bacterium]
MIYFWIFIQQSIASVTHIVGQDATRALDPFALLFFRVLVAAFSLFVVVSIKERRLNLFADVNKQDVGRLFLLGALNILINQLLYFEGLRITTPANSALLYALTPAIVFILAIRVHWETTNWKKIAGIIIAFVGTAILMFEHGASFSSEHTKGNVFIFIAVIAWSIFTLLGKPLILKYGALRVTAMHMATGALLYLPIGLWNVRPDMMMTFSISMWSEILYLGIFASCVNYVLWYYALGKLETSKVAIFQNLQPVLTTILALSLGRAELTGELIGGGVLALGGVLLVQFG